MGTGAVIPTDMQIHAVKYWPEPVGYQGAAASTSSTSRHHLLFSTSWCNCSCELPSCLEDLLLHQLGRASLDKSFYTGYGC